MTFMLAFRETLLVHEMKDIITKERREMREGSRSLEKLVA